MSHPFTGPAPLWEYLRKEPLAPLSHADGLERIRQVVAEHPIRAESPMAAASKSRALNWIDAEDGLRIVAFWLLPADVLVLVGAGETPIDICPCIDCAVSRVIAGNWARLLAGELPQFRLGIHSVIDHFTEGCGMHVVTPKRPTRIVIPTGKINA